MLVVTGAASGIGAAVTATAAARGQTVLALDRTPWAGPDEPRIIRAVCDVRDADDVERAIAAGTEAAGATPSQLVHCAGTYELSPAEDGDAQLWRRVMDINATGSFNVASRVGSRMLAGNGGGIVLLSSIAYVRGDPIEPDAAYAASKGAVVSLGRQLAVEWGRLGVRTNVVVPGVIATPMVTITDDPEGWESVRTRIPLGRAGEAAEVAEACLFLASDAASFINGAVLTVDGGQSVG